jgi:hypothetical protein
MNVIDGANMYLLLHIHIFIQNILILYITILCITLVNFIYDYIPMYHTVCGTLFPAIILYEL